MLRSIQRSHSQHRYIQHGSARSGWALVLLATASLFSFPVAGDWLVTTEGDAIETRGTWKVKGRMVVFNDAKGTLSSLRLSQIDLEASKAATAAAVASANSSTTGGVQQPEPSDRPPIMVLTNADVARAEFDRPAAELAPQPPVVMYSTSWCGYCRKARQLLDELQVTYVEKDIEKSAEAKREHAAIARGSGVPVLDIGGTVIRGYSAQAIRKAVADLSPPVAADEDAAQRDG